MGGFFEADFTDGQVLQTFNGETIRVTLSPFSVNGIAITEPSWVPRTLLNRVEDDSDLTIFNEFLEVSGVAPAATGNFTLLAPTNAAWLALGEETLLFLSEIQQMWTSYEMSFFIISYAESLLCRSSFPPGSIPFRVTL
jgi:hypothetical protein